MIPFDIYINLSYYYHEAISIEKIILMYFYIFLIPNNFLKKNKKKKKKKNKPREVLVKFFRYSAVPLLRIRPSQNTTSILVTSIFKEVLIYVRTYL